MLQSRHEFGTMIYQLLLITNSGGGQVMSAYNELERVAKLPPYQRKTEIPKAMNQIIQEYQSGAKKETICTYAKEILCMCYKIQLTELYSLRLRDPSLNSEESAKLNEKKRFQISEPVKRQYNTYNRWDKAPQNKSRPMTFNELHDELQCQLKWFAVNKPEKKIAVQADLTVLGELKDDKTDSFSNGKMLAILKAVTTYVLEITGTSQDAYPELVAFLASTLSSELLCEDAINEADFKDPMAVSSQLTSAIREYKRYQDKMLCLDGKGAAQHLRIVSQCGFSCYENILKYYLYRWTDYLARNGKRSAADLLRIENLKNTDGRYMDIEDVLNDFNTLHTEVTQDPQINEPVIDVDWNLLTAGWRVYTQVKHRNAVPNAGDLKTQIKEIIKLVRLIYPPTTSNPEWDRFLSDDQSQTSQEAPITLELKTEPTDPEWLAFRELCGNFDSDSYHYVLVAPDNLNPDYYGRLLAMQWDMIIDMNPSSSSDGLMYTYEQMYGTHAKARTPGEKQDEFRPVSAPYWIRGNGDYNQPDKVMTKFRPWKIKYGSHLKVIFSLFHSRYTRPVKIIYLPGHDPFFQAEIIDNAIEAFSVVATGGTYGVEQILMDNHDLIDDLRDASNGNPISDSLRCANISLEKAADGFASMNSLDIAYQRKSFPGMKAGAEIEDNMKLEEYFEPVYLNLGTDTNDAGRNIHDFYRGVRKISWSELALELDLRREQYTNDILPTVRQQIAESNRPFCHIGYKPGYGGTTMLRRMAWDLHKEYPTLIVRHYDASCVQLLLYLRSKLEEGKPLVLLIDNNDMSENDARSLHADLGINSVTSAIIYFKRRDRGSKTDRRLKELRSVDDILNKTEITKMVYLLERTELEDSCRQKLQRKLNQSFEPAERTPFWLSMYAYDKDFVGFSSYVRNFLTAPSQKKYRNFLLYIALQNRAIHGQKLDAEFFAYHMENAQTGKEAQEILLERDEFANLVVFEKEGKTNYCRMRHARLADEVLIQLTNGVGNDSAAQTINYNTLAADIQQFIWDTRIQGIYNKNLEELLQQLLIDRDSSYCEDRDNFSRIILAISRGGKRSDHDCTPATHQAAAQVLQTLAECYDENPHFAGHYARYLSERLGAHDDAQRELERALSINDNINDSSLLHMLGTVHFRKVEKCIKEIQSSRDKGRDYKDLMPVLQADVAKASDLFEEVRKFATSSVAGILSNIKLCMRIIQMGKALENVDTDIFFQLPGKEWYHRLRDRANELFAECEEFSDFMNETDYRNYMEIQAQIHVINESSSKCLRLYKERLQKADLHVQAMLRRQMAYVYNQEAIRESENKENAFNPEPYYEIMALMNENILDDPTNTANFRQWFRAAFNSRCGDDDLVTEAMVKVEQWLDADPQDFQAQLYRYMLTFLQAVTTGATLAEAKLPGYRQDLQSACRSRGISRLEDTKFVLARGTGLQCLQPVRFDLSNVDEVCKRLLPVKGTLDRKAGYRKGYIRSFSTDVLFNPQQTNGAIRDEHFTSHARVTYGALFTYDGVKAYSASVKTEAGKADRTPLEAGRPVKCIVRAQTAHYLILNIHGHSVLAKLHYDELVPPFGRDNIPALGKELNVFLKHLQEIEYNSQRELVWVVEMEKTPGTSNDLNTPLAQNPQLMKLLEHLNK
jgi:hypothetical protein